MADLDDFFAKKDRKKSKSKKFATTEELARKSEDTSKKVETKPKKERPAPGADGEDVDNIEKVSKGRVRRNGRTRAVLPTNVFHLTRSMCACVCVCVCGKLCIFVGYVDLCEFVCAEYSFANVPI